MFERFKASGKGSAVDERRSAEIAALEHQVKVLQLLAEAEEAKAKAQKATAEIDKAAAESEKAQTKSTRERVEQVRTLIFCGGLCGVGLFAVVRVVQVLLGSR